jgi:SMI1 / KNR4 family (SUKH-1)
MTLRDLGFEVRYGRCADAQFRAFEVKLGVKLPEQYRRFVLDDGGGWSPRLRFFPVKWTETYSGPESEKPEWLALLGFHRDCGIDDPESVVGLWEALRHREPDDFGLPQDALSIASTASFHVVLGIAGERAGQVGVIYLN